MVESLKELNKLCQKSNYKTVGNWMVRHLLRDAALPITWLLLHTKISADQVTLVALVCGLVGESFLVGQGAGAFITGMILIQIWYLLDHVDGQIARYRKTADLTGRFFDFMMHHMIHGVIFFSLGMYAYFATGHISYIVLSFISSISMILFNVIHDATHKTFFEKLMAQEIYQTKPQVPKDAFAPSLSSRGLLRRAYSVLHKSCEIHVIMNLLTLLAILEWIPLFGGIDGRLISCLSYGIMAPLLFITKMLHVLRQRTIDHKFSECFERSL